MPHFKAHTESPFVAATTLAAHLRNPLYDSQDSIAGHLGNGGGIWQRHGNAVQLSCPFGKGRLKCYRGEVFPGFVLHLVAHSVWPTEVLMA